MTFTFCKNIKAIKFAERIYSEKLSLTSSLVILITIDILL